MPIPPEDSRPGHTSSGREQPTQRRLNRPKDKDDLLQLLTEQGPFQEYRDVLVFAAALGWYQRKRLPLGAKGEAIRWETATNRKGTEALVNMIAAAESENPEILAAELFDERLEIFEEYANGGLEILQTMLKSEIRPPLDVLLELVQSAFKGAIAREVVDLTSAAEYLEF